MQLSSHASVDLVYGTHLPTEHTESGGRPWASGKSTLKGSEYSSAGLVRVISVLEQLSVELGALFSAEVDRRRWTVLDRQENKCIVKVRLAATGILAQKSEPPPSNLLVCYTKSTGGRRPRIYN